MKRIKSTVYYTVPNWNFCNSDNLINGGELSKHTCRFCVKDKTGYYCLLHDEPLSVKDALISKVHECCKATAGFNTTIDTVPPPGPTVEPREIIRQTIDLYNRTLDDLMRQGYPRQLAQNAARQYILDN